MSVKAVSNEQFKRLAGDLRCEPEALMAVSQVEAPHGAFTADGHPTILFERHVFYKNARRDKRDEWHRLYPTICNPTRTPKGGYGTPARIREKYEFALTLDSHAAMMACSWGAFQELGANYDDYGFLNVKEFVAMMKSGVEGQLEIFVRSIRHRGLADELRRLDWRGFARNYNGAGYAEFEYHIHMAEAYRAAKAKRINWALINVAPKFDDDEILQLTDNIGSDSTEQGSADSNNGLPQQPAINAVEQPEPGANGSPGVSGDGNQPIGDAPDAAPSSILHLEDWKPFAARWLSRLWAAVTTITIPGGFGLGFAALKDPPNWFIYVAIAVVVLIVVFGLAIIVSLVLLAIWYFNRKEIRAGKELAAQSLIDPNSKNLGITIEAK